MWYKEKKSRKDKLYQVGEDERNLIKCRVSFLMMKDIVGTTGETWAGWVD